MSWISETDTLQDRETINGELLPLSNKLMFQVLGNPRGTYSSDCQPITDARIRRLIVTENVGPFRATGLMPAVNALKAIVRDVEADEPEIYAVLGSAGMLCVRFVRGSNTAISNHSWGCAIDLTLEGKLDFRGDGKVQNGLKRLHPIFNRHGFFWGAAFRTEDAMHFEVSRQLLLDWHRDGTLGDHAPLGALDTIELGDRGPEVEAIQKQLNILTGADLTEDGVFGVATRAAVIAFQNLHRHAPDGIVDDATRQAMVAMEAAKAA